MNRARLWALVAVAALAAACPGGVLHDRGNAFPCDFSQTEVTSSGRLQRDLACPSGWLCGVANLCQQNEPGDLLDCEGACVEPQMDGGQILPRSPGPIQAVALGPESVAGLREGGGWFEISTARADGGVRPPLVLPSESRANTSHAVIHRGAVVYEADQRVYRAQASGPSEVLTHLGAPVTPVSSLLRTSILRDELACVAGGEMYLAREDAPATTTRHAVAAASIYDVGTVNPALFADTGTEQLLAVTDVGFYYLESGGSWRSVSTEPMPTAPIHALTRSIPGTFWATTTRSNSVLVEPDGTKKVLARGVPQLSSWAVTGAPTATKLSRQWGDCAPCVRRDERGMDLGHIVAAIPIGAGSVEVMCSRAFPLASERSPFFFRRVYGVDATVPTICAGLPFVPPFDPAEVNVPAALNGEGIPVRPAADLSIGFALGGKHGQIWAGVSLAPATPLILDRVPTEVVETPVGIVAITEAFFAGAGALEGPGKTDLFTVPSGGVRLEAVSAAPFGAIAITSDGDVLFRLGAALRFGPRLLNPRGDPTRGPYTINETATENLYVITADDALYLYEADVETAREVPGELPGVFPLFTPEPNFPVRGAAIDRSTRRENLLVRGFTLTARSVFLFEVQDAPRVARIVPLLEGVGEPLEVWMRSAQPVYATARVGFRDGQIFTLPAGIPYANALPEGERVRDFAPMGPWPFALTESGVLYRGKLEQEGRPLVWVREKYPDGSEPWVGQRGKLFVSFPPPGTRPFEYRLYLFAEHGAVYKAATYVE